MAYKNKKISNNTLNVIKIIFLLCVSTLLCHAQPEEDWKLQKNRDGISVFTKLNSGSKYKSVKAITEFHCVLPVLVEMIKDVDSHDQWVSHCTQSKLLKTIGDSCFIFYENFEVPWPASDRDVIIQSVVNIDKTKNVVFVNQEGKPGYLPEKKNIVRIPVYHGSWKLVAYPNGTVYADYRASVDPGGYVPAWIINLFAANSPYESILKLKKIIAKMDLSSSAVSPVGPKIERK
jgi:hypothetical protein